VEHVTLTVKYRVMERLTINDVNCDSAQQLVLKRPAAEVEDHSNATKMRRPDVYWLPLLCLKAATSTKGGTSIGFNWPVRRAVRRTESSRLGLPMISSR